MDILGMDKVFEKAFVVKINTKDQTTTKEQYSNCLFLYHLLQPKRWIFRESVFSLWILHRFQV